MLFKGAVVAVLVYLGYEVLVGVSRLNWSIVGQNIGTLLIWRFPQTGEEDFRITSYNVCYTKLLRYRLVDSDGYEVTLEEARKQVVFKPLCK